MRKSHIILFTLIALGFSTGMNAQQSEDLSTRFSMGLQLNQYQNDFGMGIQMASPYFANDKVYFRLRGNVMYHQHIQGTEYTWSPYTSVSLGAASVAGTIGNFMRLYGEGGIIGLFPSAEFSSETTNFGGYGLFGFEFYMMPCGNYFIEIGGVGTGAKADRVIANPIYSNGLTVSTGFRVHL